MTSDTEQLRFQLEKKEAEVSKLRERVRELKEALKPFAEADEELAAENEIIAGVRNKVFVKDFRRACAELEKEDANG